MQFEEFNGCLEWLSIRRRMSALGKFLLRSYSQRTATSDRKNPSAKEDITHLPPQQLAESIRQKELRIADIMTKIATLLASTSNE